MLRGRLQPIASVVPPVATVVAVNGLNYTESVHRGIPNTHGRLRLQSTGNASIAAQITTTEVALVGQPLAGVAVYIDGVYSTLLQPAANGVYWYQITLPDTGAHTVEINSGVQSTNNGYLGTVTGSWASAYYPSSGVQVVPTPHSSRRAVIYEDSIAADAPTVVGKTDWPSLLKGDYPGRVSCESWGSRNLGVEVVADLVGWMNALCYDSTSIDVILAIGTNDYGLNQSSAAAFGTKYGALCDALVAAIGARLRKIWCVTLFPRNNEVANTFGNVPDDYRAAIVTAVSTRSATCTVIDGKGMGLTLPTDYAGDGLHPIDSGHAKIHTAIGTAIA